jgi:hypothetical protein
MYITIKKLYNELVRLGGQTFTLEMHRRFGGECAIVANRKSKWYKTIEELLGVAAADEFYSKYKNQVSVYVGKMDRLLAAKRNEKLKAEYKNGVDYRLLARKYNLSTVYVRKLVQHHPVRDRKEKLKADRQNKEVDTENG